MVAGFLVKYMLTEKTRAVWNKLWEEAYGPEKPPELIVIPYEKFRSKIYSQRRRIIKRINESSHTEAEWECVKICFDYRCAMCGLREPDVKLTKDHKIPVSKGGPDTIDNIQPLCGPCNSYKGARTWFSFCVMPSFGMS